MITINLDFLTKSNIILILIWNIFNFLNTFIFNENFANYFPTFLFILIFFNVTLCNFSLIYKMLNKTKIIKYNFIFIILLILQNLFILLLIFIVVNDILSNLGLDRW